MAEPTYQRPVVTEIGSLAELTLIQNKDYNPVSDGLQFQHQNVNDAS